MAVIDIDNMYKEMFDTMQNNFSGTAAQRFSKAKKLFLTSVSNYIDNNKKQLIYDFKERSK